MINACVNHDYQSQYYPRLSAKNTTWLRMLGIKPVKPFGGKWVFGHCLNKRYRYYQCSDASPYENSKNKCEARYIRANDLEQTVWSKTKAVLSDPGIILDQLTENSNKECLETIEADIKALERQLRSYDKRRANLLQPIEWDEFSKDEILDRMSEIKRLQLEDEAKLNDLLKTRDNLASLANAKIKFSNLYDRVLQSLENTDSGLKRLALDALDIKVYASNDSIEIKVVIPLELALPTIGQTSGCLIVNDYNSSTGRETVSIIPR
ncbi:recombinase zinc beta ribbon domain-containing protein [Chloroflexota bacterium]